MKTYYSCGIAKEEKEILLDTSDFYIQEINLCEAKQYTYPGDSIKYELDDELVLLYDTLRDLLFANSLEYYQERSILPIFVQEAGQDSECALSAELFGTLIQKEEYKSLPNFYKHLYLVDCQFLVGSIQNMLSGMEDAFIRYFVHISSCEISFPKQNTTMYGISPQTAAITALLESYFVKAYSILDMLCKICYEMENLQSDFSSYRKIKSADILWGARKNLRINNTKETLFEKCDLVNTIESLRNEVVHNGTWELNPKVFIKYEDGVACEKFMLFPDLSQGRLATVKGRKHFFSEGKKVNDVLPLIHEEFKKRLLNTVRIINQSKTKD